MIQDEADDRQKEKEEIDRRNRGIPQRKLLADVIHASSAELLRQIWERGQERQKQ